MKPKKALYSEDVNPNDLSSVAKHRVRTSKMNLSSLRSTDINSAGGRNSTIPVNGSDDKKGR